VTLSAGAAVSRSLIGHRANCISLAFPGSDTNLLVSGSLDCNVKVWDLRRKEAIVTFKGHKKGVQKLATSPDNKWVCSGSEDGELKVGTGFGGQLTGASQV
jgi:katanin p80 WD40 repeat-containing subunit B1